MKRFLTFLLISLFSSSFLLALPRSQSGFGGLPSDPKGDASQNTQEKEQMREQLRQEQREQLREEFQKVFQAMNLTKEQVRQMQQIINQVRERLNALSEEYDRLRENAPKMSANEFRLAVQQLNQKRLEILRDAVEKLGDVITVEQLQRFMECWQLQIRDHVREVLRLYLVDSLYFFGETFLEILGEYAE